MEKYSRHFAAFVIALHCNKQILHCNLYVNNICCPENMETAAWGGKKFYANSRWQPFWKMAQYPDFF